MGFHSRYTETKRVCHGGERDTKTLAIRLQRKNRYRILEKDSRTGLHSGSDVRYNGEKLGQICKHSDVELQQHYLQVQKESRVVRLLR